MHNIPTDEVYVIGHKNPDTDSICSAIAYARLKNLDENKYIPKRAGELSRETQFVLEYFGVDTPELATDVNIQVKDIAYRIVDGVSGDITMKKAFETMQDNDATTLPVVEDGKVKGIITVGDIAEAYMLEKDDNALYIAGTRVYHIIETIHGRLVYGDADSHVRNGRVVVGAAQVDILEKHVKENDIVIVSDRVEAQLAAINRGAGMLIVCLVENVPDVVLEFAKSKDCVVIVTDADTYSVARLIGQSMPIGFFMIRDNIMTFYEDDNIDTLRAMMARTRVRYFPVTDGYGNYKGLVSRRNYINARRKQLILVDHNERTQTVGGVENAEILEIIDHHRIANIETMNPVYFRNQPLGCTATIILQMYKEKDVLPDKSTAGLMCAAILSDTLAFKSPTCTACDEAAAKELANIAGIDMYEFAMEMFDAGSNLKGKTMNEILHQDFKKFDIGDAVMAIGQINSVNGKETDRVSASMKAFLADYTEPGCDTILFVMTNILQESSDIICVGRNAEELCSGAFGVQLKDGCAHLTGVVSRKKQIVPALVAAEYRS